MALKSGEYAVTLDDKGRVSIPSHFRDGISENVLILTKGIRQNCIWVHTPQLWEKVSANLQGTLLQAMSFEKADMIRHRVNFSTSEVEIDRSGRIAVPQNLRDFAGLDRDCIIASDGKRIEIWDAARYADYQKEIDEQIQSVLKDIQNVDLYI